MTPSFLLPLAISLAFWPGILSPAIAPRWWIIAIGMGMVFPIRNFPPIPQPISAFLTLSSISILLSIRNPVGLGEAIHWGILGMAFLWGMSLRNFRPVMLGFAIGLAINSIIAFFQFFSWNTIPGWESASPGGLFYNREVLAELAAPILVWGIVRSSTWTILFAIAPTILCQSRVAILSITVGFLTTYHYISKSNYSKIIIGFFTILTTITIASLSIFMPYKLNSLFDRLSIWREAISSLSPFGKGLAYWELQHPESRYVHSDILQLMVEIGIIPSLPILLLPLLILWKARHARPEYFAPAIVLLLESTISFPLQQPATAFLAATLFGFLSRDCQGRDGRPVPLLLPVPSLRPTYPDKNLGLPRKMR